MPKAPEYRLSYLVGKWAGETQLKQVIVPESKNRDGKQAWYNKPSCQPMVCSG